MASTSKCLILNLLNYLLSNYIVPFYSVNGVLFVCLFIAMVTVNSSQVSRRYHKKESGGVTISIARFLAQVNIEVDLQTIPARFRQSEGKTTKMADLVKCALFACLVVSSVACTRFLVHKDTDWSNASEVVETIEKIEKIQANTANYCILRCVSNDRCKSVSWSQSEMVCKYTHASPFDFGSTAPIAAPGWNLYIRSNDTAWRAIAKFSASDGSFTGDFSHELWNNPNNSLNSDPCATSGNDVRCNRHFVHSNKDWILGMDHVTLVKVSLYEAGVEAAWVTFSKQPGGADVWFQGSRVVDSHPWDPVQLRTAWMSTDPLEHASEMRWSITEPNDSGYKLEVVSPYRSWFKVYEHTDSDAHFIPCQFGIHSSPYIVYSKTSGPEFLSKSKVSNVVGRRVGVTYPDNRYPNNWAEAQENCQDYLKVSVATQAELNAAIADESYSCCSGGWASGGIVVIPMSLISPGCQNIGINIQPSSVGWNPTNNWATYCAPNVTNTGEADTMVISVNL